MKPPDREFVPRNERMRLHKDRAAVEADFGRDLSAEPVRRRASTRRVAHASLIIRIQNRVVNRRLGLEQSALCIRVILKRMVTVKMIGRDVCTNADVSAELVNGFELETGQFQHVPLFVSRCRDHRRRRCPDIAPDLAGNSAFF
jgi:hypothetical protein